VVGRDEGVGARDQGVDLAGARGAGAIASDEPKRHEKLAKLRGAHRDLLPSGVC
jgi:hypothetical protein